jgi:peptidoglycan/LPS O-acetylase OafA/YrhL
MPSTSANTMPVSGARTPATVARAAPRVGYIHNFRGLAVLLIVTTHVLSVFDWSDSPTLERTLKYLFANGTVLFLFISGYLFEWLSRSFVWPVYWGKKLRFVVLPYVLVSLPALYLVTHQLPRDGLREGFYDQPLAWQVIEFLVTGSHLAPFWFIPTITLFFAAAPLLRAAFRHDKAFWVLPLLFLIPLWLLRSANPLLNAVHFLPIWVMGMACCRFRDQVEPALQRNLLWLLLLTATFTWAKMTYTTGTHTYLGYLEKTFLTLFLLALLRWAGGRADRWLAKLGAYSFGIFFVHSYVISAGKLVLARLHVGPLTGSVLGVAAAALLAVSASVAIVAGVRWALGKRSRLVIGV